MISKIGKSATNIRILIINCNFHDCDEKSYYYVYN